MRRWAGRCRCATARRPGTKYPSSSARTRRRRVAVEVVHGDVDRRRHVLEPPGPLLAADVERQVAQSQAGMAALVGVRRRPTPVLHEEQPQAVASAGQVWRLGVQAKEHRIGGHAVVEGVDEAAEERLRRPPARTAARRACPRRSRYRPVHGQLPTRHPHARALGVHRRAHGQPDERAQRAGGAYDCARSRRRHADRCRPGRPADAADPARRCQGGRRGRDVHGLLVDLHRPRPAAGRAPPVLRRVRGLHGDRQGRLGRRPASPTSSSCDSARRSTRCAPCPPRRRSTSPSSTPTRVAIPTTTASW